MVGLIAKEGAEKSSVRRPSLLQHRYTLQSINLVLSLVGWWSSSYFILPAIPICIPEGGAEKLNRRSFDFFFFVCSC